MAAAEVVGEVGRINNVPFTIVGVAPPDRARFPMEMPVDDTVAIAAFDQSALTWPAFTTSAQRGISRRIRSPRSSVFR